MKIVLENQFVKTWVEGELPVIFSRVLKTPQSSIMMQEFCDLHETLITQVAARQQGGVYSICDTYNMEPFMFQMLVNYYVHRLARQQRLGLTFKALVKPKNFERFAEAPEVFRKVENRAIGLFENFDQACYYVRNEWKQLTSGKLLAAS